MKKELLSAVICCAWKQRESHFLTHQDHLNWPNQPAHACLSVPQELSEAFVYFLLCNPVQLSQVRRTTMFRAPLLATSDENHKKLKARGENNIIRDYFHSSVGFASAPHESQQNSDRLPLDYRFLQPSPLTARLVFFFLILCTITLDLTPTSIVSTSHGSCSDAPAGSSHSGFQPHEFLKSSSRFYSPTGTRVKTLFLSFPLGKIRANRKI